MALQQKKPESTQDIQDRMNREAASIYRQYTGRQIGAIEGFDPLVYMLLGACASEFERISQDIQISSARLLEHTAQLLIPESHTGPLPAAAVIHAQPIPGSGAVMTHPENQVYLPDHQGKEAFFSPAGNYPLWEGRVACLAWGETLFQLDKALQKVPLARVQAGKTFPAGTLWIGISPGGSETPETIRLFFDLKQRGIARYLGPMLQSARWFAGTEEMEAFTGLEPRAKPSIHRHLHLSEKLETEAEALFSEQFVRIRLPKAAPAAASPSEWASHFDASTLDKLQEPLIWIQATFSPAFFPPQERPDALFTKLTCLLNCFPVLNRRFHEVSFQLSGILNLFPLKTDDQLLGVEQVLSTQLKKIYQEKPFLEVYQQEDAAPPAEARSYALRKEGVSRFDSRDASALISNLVRYFREESHIFSAMGRDMLTQNINALERALNDIETKIRQSRNQQAAPKEPPVYIAFPPGNREGVIVRFWSTRGLSGNHIPSGSPLEPYSKDLLWQKGGIYFLTESAGGRNPLGEMDRLHAYKSALISRGKIVTREDIRAYCFEMLGDRIRKVEIGPGVIAGASPTQGLIRSLEVRLYPETAENLQSDFWHYHQQKLERDLNAASTGLVPIRVCVHAENR